MKLALLCAVLLPVFLLEGCKQNAPDSVSVEKVVKREGQPAIDYVADGDKAMNAAIQKAQATIGTFISAFGARKAGQSNFAVKQKFDHANGGEHMWIGDLQFDGKVFRGRLNNQPHEVKNLKLGDAVTVDLKKISDWMYVDKGKLVGGYTVRALTDKMSTAERKALEKAGGYKLD